MATWTSAPDPSWVGGDGFPPPTDDTSEISGFEEQVEPEKEKPQRVRKKEIEQLQTDRQDDKEKMVPVYTRHPDTNALVELLPKFPRGAAAVFSGPLKKGVSGGSVIIEPNLFLKADLEPKFLVKRDLEPVKRILDWINLCVDEGNDIKFPEIVGVDNALSLLLEIVRVANRLKIPEGSLQSQLKKAAIKYARQSIISIEHVVLIYDDRVKDYLGESEHLREAAAASVFEAWWSRALDAPEYDGYCSYIEQLRVEFPTLDEDLNKRFDSKKEYIEKKRKEKREEKRQGRVAGGGGGGGRNHGFHAAADYPEASGPDGGWGDAAATVVDDHVGEWDVTGAAEPAETLDWGEAEAW